MYNLSHVQTERTYTPAQLQTLVKSCQLSSLVFPFGPTSAALVRNPSRCFVKRSAVLFFVSTRITDLQNVCCFKKIDQLRMLLRLDFSTIFTEFLHRLPYCDHLGLSSCSARWYASSSTLNARCPATGMNESAEEDDPFASPARKPSDSKSSLGRRHSIEVCPTRMFRHSRSLLVFRLQREICFLCRSHSCRIRSLRAILEVHLRTVNVRVPIGYDLKLVSDFVTHSSSCWSCCLQLVPILRRPALRISFLERIGLHLVIICTLVLSLDTHRVERTCCDCGLSTSKL